MKYGSSEDANFYLHGSIVRHEGRAVFVSSVNGNMMAKCYIVGDHNPDHITVHVCELDLSPIKLGYVLDEEQDRVLYIERYPSRMWRQGLTPSNCRAKGYALFHFPRHSSKLAAAICNPFYPSLRKAYLLAKKNEREIPFDRVFSIDNEDVIRYKTKEIGKYKDKRVVLSKKFKYLAELVEEKIHANT